MIGSMEHAPNHVGVDGGITPGLEKRLLHLVVPSVLDRTLLKKAVKYKNVQVKNVYSISNISELWSYTLKLAIYIKIPNALLNIIHFISLK